MTRSALFLTLLLVASVASAAPDNTVQAGLTYEVGMAFMVMANDEHHVAREDRLYRHIIGRLQRQVKTSGAYVFNAAMAPEDQPDWSRGLESVKQAVSVLDNKHLETIVLVSATINPKDSDRQSNVRLTLQFYDVATASVYATLNEELVVAHHDARKGLVHMAQLILPRTTEQPDNTQQIAGL